MKTAQMFNTPVCELTTRGRGKTGDLWGVELEMEGSKVMSDDGASPKGWEQHRDGSLRDHHGQAIEWVFAQPTSYKHSVKRVNELFEFLTLNKAKLVCSGRTSTHVHFNMGDKKGYQVVNLFVLYTILEDVMTRFCGDTRRGNLFCLNVREASELLDLMSLSVFKFGNFVEFSDRQRYGGLNLSSLNKFGSVEFRCMRGLDNAKDVNDWLGILNDFCNYACYTMVRPTDIIRDISHSGPIGFIKTVFSERSAELLLSTIPENELWDSLYEGVRLIQMFAYRADPFFDGVKPVAKDWWADKAEDVGVIIDDPVDEPGLNRARGVIDAARRNNRDRLFGEPVAMDFNRVLFQPNRARRIADVVGRVEWNEEDED